MDKEFFDSSLINLSDEEAKEYIIELAKGYKKRKDNKVLYNLDDLIPENIIGMYLFFVYKNKYSLILENYKNEFVINEALVEPGVTDDERIGLGMIYDYIGGFDYEKDFLNLFFTPLKLHSILYSACKFPEFGGKLRESTAVMNDTDIDVLDAKSAKEQFNSYLNVNIEYDKKNLFEYIDWAIRVTIDLIRIQPFPDGNKRTFRALLNLLLGKIGIPPVFIKLEERNEYKKELLNALSNYDYKGITRFYYYKICDSIVDFGIKNLNISPKEQEKKFIIKPINR